MDPRRVLLALAVLISTVTGQLTLSSDTRTVSTPTPTSTSAGAVTTNATIATPSISSSTNATMTIINGTTVALPIPSSNATRSNVTSIQSTVPAPTASLPSTSDSSTSVYAPAGDGHGSSSGAGPGDAYIAASARLALPASSISMLCLGAGLNYYRDHWPLDVTATAYGCLVCSDFRSAFCVEMFAALFLCFVLQATCAPTLPSLADSRPASRAMSTYEENVASSTNNAAARSLEKRLWERLEDYAISVTLVKGVRFQSSTGEWTAPHPLMTKFVQQFTVLKWWNIEDLYTSIAPQCIFDFATIDGASASAQLELVFVGVHYWRIQLAWRGFVGLEGSPGAERQTAFLFQQCCDVEYQTTLYMSFVDDPASIKYQNIGTQATLVCEPEHGVVSPPTPECEELYQTGHSRYNIAMRLALHFLFGVLATFATSAPTGSAYSQLDSQALSNPAETLTSNIDDAATGSMHKRYFDRVEDYAVSITFAKGVKFQSTTGEWTSPHPLTTKFVQRFTVHKSWTFQAIYFEQAPTCTFDFAPKDGASAEAQFGLAPPYGLPYWTIELSWHDFISLDGTSGQERETLYLFQQCCDVKYTTTLFFNFMIDVATMYKHSIREAKLICEPEHGVINPPTPECEELYNTARARYDYEPSQSFHAELLDGDLRPTS
ncbi:uncharacterized protein L969DRAFT_97250 [Mixia osmundae IAM 14324]|uniref:Membrane-associated protein n=1 Tax=Mixia osmundae (strain CBS 9802 / IAM 14324 / JCM 22182 / KY 12970) TaxID=764103 RepID=G7DW98_MIXOS|nr:uncharacterized protein L969DRAFT_97250 [Mixia osmundae IAM 14324]KEI36515.1 hypothetical protein L969DRAFT_97250 [Mixia osmundae IAM 14324]GAA94786.1 hypothetical protein E5Q_01440 [Mixia osmundae IAM 14324]